MRGVVVLAIAGACSFSADVPSGATPDDGGGDAADDAMTDASAPGDGAKPPAFHLRIATIVDGESYLHVKGTMVWLENRIFAAPGRWDADGAAPWTMEPVMLNATAWQPTWPDVPDPENRDCMCLSSVTQLPVGVPQVPSTTTLDPINVRRTQSIIQAPSAANGWELIVTVSDYMVGGAHPDFVLEVDVVPN